MKDKSFTATIKVDQSPEEVFDAITNVRGWWSQAIEGDTKNLNDEFLYYFTDVHRSKMRLVDVVPGKRMVWLVLDNYFNFVEDQHEWNNTQVVFDISREGDKTVLHFAHDGLVPAFECYEACREGWSHYITESLRDLVVTGKGQPNPAEGGFNAELARKWERKQ